MSVFKGYWSDTFEQQKGIFPPTILICSKRSPFHGVLYVTYQSTIFLATSVETHVTTPVCCNFPNLFCTSHLKCAHQSDEPTPSMMRLGTKSLSHSALVHTWRFAIITSSKSLYYLYRLFSSKVLVQALPEGILLVWCIIYIYIRYYVYALILHLPDKIMVVEM